MTQSTLKSKAVNIYFQNLNQYMEEYVLDENKEHKCNHESECEDSCKNLKRKFRFGQLHHVGERYDDVKRNGKPFRIMISGGEYGKDYRCSMKLQKESRLCSGGEYGKDYSCSMKQRQCAISKLEKPDNQHMGLTLFLLQILFGQPLNPDNVSININGDKPSIFTTFALANFLLCTGKTDKVNPTAKMKKNCGHHFKKTIEILKPQIIILQGVRSREFFKKEYDISLDYVNARVETLKILDNNILILPIYQRGKRDSYIKPAVITLLKKYDKLYK